MNICEVTIAGVNPMLIRTSMPPDEKLAKQANETHEQHDERTWRELVHFNREGYACIVAPQIRKGLVDAARHLAIQVPGKGKSTFTKRFERGIAIKESVIIIEPKVKKDKLAHIRLYVPGNPNQPKGSRVWRYFPVFEDWSAQFTIIVLDADIREQILRKHLEAMGLLIGIGAMRKGNGGEGGQYRLTAFRWKSD